MRQLRLFEYEPSKEKLPTNLTTNRHPIHRWFNFIAGFSPEFVSSCIQESGLTADEMLIDPFSGLSTSLVQANFHGICSVGFEAHPFFYDISLANFQELKRVLRPQSHVHIVVADAALYGIHIQTEKLLSQIMEENGFEILTS
jgi:DNA modification methylase